MDVAGSLKLLTSLNGVFSSEKDGKMKCICKKDRGRESSVLGGKHTELCSVAASSIVLSHSWECIF